MSNALVIKATATIQNVDGDHLVSSTAIARLFDKRHDHVLRDIREILPQVIEMNGPKFGANKIKTLAGNTEVTEYLMDKDAFLLLVMGYKTKKALAMKIAYIQAFNEMASRLSISQPSFDPAAYITGLIKENAAFKAQVGKPFLAAPEGMELVPTIELLFRKANAVQSLMKDSEAAFVDSVYDQYQSRKDLSPKQRAVLNEIVGRVERRAARA